MKKTLTIFLMLLSLTAQAQWDTVGRTRLRPKTVPLVGAALFSTGALISIRPEFHDREISIYNHRGLADVTKLHFDDYLQFAPTLAAFALNLAGLESEHNFGQMTLLTGTSALIGMAAIESAKLFYQVQRPDGRGYSSFPSGTPTWPSSGPKSCAANTASATHGSPMPAMAWPPWWASCACTTAATGSATSSAAPA